MALWPVLRWLPLVLVRILTKAFGLATVTFFGRAPTQDDHKVAFVGILSLTWCLLLPGILFPPLLGTLIPLLPDDEALLRILTVIFLITGGLLVGVIIGRTANRSETGARLMLTAVEGYGYALVIGLLTLLLILVVPVIKVSHLLRNLEIKHLPVMVTPGAFEHVEKRILETLNAHGIQMEVVPENRVLSAIFRSLVWVEEKIFRREMTNQISIIRTELEDGPLVVELHPTDIAVRARRKNAVYIYATLADTLDDRHVYFTWDKASQRLEDRIRAGREAAAEGDPMDDESIAELTEGLRRTRLEPGQWGALRRQVYRLETDILRARLGHPEDPQDPPATDTGPGS